MINNGIGGFEDMYSLEPINFLAKFNKDLAKYDSIENTCDLIDELVVLVDTGFISIFDDKIDAVFEKCRDVFGKQGAFPNKVFTTEKFFEFKDKFVDLTTVLEEVSDDMKNDCDLYLRNRIVDRDEMIHVMVDGCYQHGKDMRKNSENSNQNIANISEINEL